APTVGKPFRVMSGGRVRGPYSLQEVRNLLAAGKIGDGDLIGVETWLPVATLGGLVEGGPVKRGGAPVKSAEADEQEEEETGDFEMVEEEDTDSGAEDAEDEAPAAKSDEDMIPVDDEFQLG